MDPQTIPAALPAVLLLHGLAIAALAWIAARPGGPTGDWHAARSWLMPALPADTATAVACTFWALARSRSRGSLRRRSPWPASSFPLMH